MFDQAVVCGLGVVSDSECAAALASGLGAEAKEERVLRAKPASSAQFLMRCGCETRPSAPCWGRADRPKWMPTGPLGLLPVYEAEHLGEPGALDSVMSSCTPPLRVRASSGAALRALPLAHVEVGVGVN